jgi:hypothetical protein
LFFSGFSTLRAWSLSLKWMRRLSSIHFRSLLKLVIGRPFTSFAMNVPKPMT